MTSQNILLKKLEQENKELRLVCDSISEQNAILKMKILELEKTLPVGKKKKKEIFLKSLDVHMNKKENEVA